MCECALSTAKGNQVGPDQHEPQIGLMAQDGEADDLLTGFFSRLDRAGYGLAVGAWRHFAKQVQYTPALVGDERYGHRGHATAGTWRRAVWSFNAALASMHGHGRLSRKAGPEGRQQMSFRWQGRA